MCIDQVPFCARVDRHVCVRGIFKIFSINLKEKDQYKELVSSVSNSSLPVLVLYVQSFVNTKVFFQLIVL